MPLLYVGYEIVFAGNSQFPEIQYSVLMTFLNLTLVFNSKVFFTHIDTVWVAKTAFLHTFNIFAAANNVNKY